MPAYLTIGGYLKLVDATNPTAPPIFEQWAWIGPSAGPTSFAMTPTLKTPKAGHQYVFTFSVSLVDDQNWTVGVSDPPPQCELNEHSPDPFPSGPGPSASASMQCDFIQEIAVL